MKTSNESQPSREFVVWGIAPGETEERPLFTRTPNGKPIASVADAERLRLIARNRGASGVRIQCVDGAFPDFVGALRN